MTDNLKPGTIVDGRLFVSDSFDVMASVRLLNKPKDPSQKGKYSAARHAAVLTLDRALTEVNFLFAGLQEGDLLAIVVRDDGVWLEPPQRKSPCPSA